MYTTDIINSFFNVHKFNKNKKLAKTNRNRNQVKFFYVDISLQVHTDGHLTIEFAFDSFMRIRHWKFIVKETIEYLPRNTLSDFKNDDSKLEEATKNVMEHGQPPKSMHYLRVSVMHSLFPYTPNQGFEYLLFVSAF